MGRPGRQLGPRFTDEQIAAIDALAFRAKVTPTRIALALILYCLDSPTLTARVIDRIKEGKRVTDIHISDLHRVDPTAVPNVMPAQAAGESPMTTGPPRRLQHCGTEAAYQRHRRNGEAPCSPCRRANTESSQRSQARRRGEAASPYEQLLVQGYSREQASRILTAKAGRS